VYVFVPLINHPILVESDAIINLRQTENLAWSLTMAANLELQVNLCASAGAAVTKAGSDSKNTKEGKKGSTPKALKGMEPRYVGIAIANGAMMSSYFRLSDSREGFSGLRYFID
jgi:hypothetical protein